MTTFKKWETSHFKKSRFPASLEKSKDLAILRLPRRLAPIPSQSRARSQSPPDPAASLPGASGPAGLLAQLSVRGEVSIIARPLNWRQKLELQVLTCKQRES